MLTRVTLALLTSAILISPLRAQMRGGALPTAGSGIPTAARGGAGFQGSLVSGPGHLHQGRDSRRHSVLLSYPYFYSDYDYESEETPKQQVVAVPVPAAASAPPARPLEPLLIEWQGDHFARMTLSQKDSASSQIAPDYSERTAPQPTVRARKAMTAPPRELPPAVLVFRDGRQEEINSYTIVSGIIYSQADYWTSGAWTRRIQVADLDVPATMKVNQERGLTFVLPSGPYEVIMRP
jgi:hypothetical protein